MRYFIFITVEGYTYQPDSESVEPDVENSQVLGFGRGKDVDEAFKDFVSENTWLQETTFNDVIAYELSTVEVARYFELHSLKS